MPVPYIFSNVPGGSSIPLAELDANFAYLLTSPTFTGPVNFTGPVTTNNLTVNGTFTIAGTAVSPTGATGTNLLVFNTNPTLVSPILGTPASGNLANCTAFPAGNLTGLAAGMLTFLTDPTSANLAATVSDETGTGNLVFSNSAVLTSPTLVTPALGTPSSGNLANCTAFPGANLTGLVSVLNGGTGLPTTGVVGDVLSVVAPGVLGYTSSPPSASVAGGAASQILFQTAPNTTSFIPNGTNGQPLVSNGILAPSWGPISLTAAVTGTLPIANGGTGANTQQAAINNLVAPSVSGTYLRSNGVNAVMSGIQAADVPTLNQNTTGSAATFTSTTQNSQFNSIGINTAAPGVAGNLSLTGTITLGTGIQFTGAFQSNAPLGYGQTWQDVTASRAASTTYTNTTPRPIMVALGLSTSSSSTATFSVSGVLIWEGRNAPALSIQYCGNSFVIPPGATYILNYTSGSYNIESWAELR